MPYKSVSDIPEAVQHSLPAHAQEIWMKAFNHAWQTYKNPEKRYNPNESIEAVASKVAWDAVKGEYKKEERGVWVPKSK